jgi:hypothetical protein
MFCWAEGIRARHRLPKHYALRESNPGSRLMPDGQRTVGLPYGVREDLMAHPVTDVPDRFWGDFPH